MFRLTRALHQLESTSSIVADGFSNTILHLTSTVNTITSLAAEPRSSDIKPHVLRKQGKTPGIIIDLPGNVDQPLSFNSHDIAKIVHKIGRTGWECQLFDVRYTDTDGAPRTHQALGRQVHITADTDEIENVTLLHCPPDRKVRLNIPFRIIGEELCPGIKAGGRVNWIRRTLPCIGIGGNIPTHFEINISKLEMNDKVYLSHLDIPSDIKVVFKDESQPLVKIRK